MGFAVLYGLARWTGGTYFGIHATAFTPMVRYHGQLNAFGFALLALVGWRLAPPESTARAPGIPFSRLSGDHRIGRDFLDRRGYATHDAASGMMASLDDYAWDGFDPSAVAPSVRRFYEHSEEYLLSVEPDWNRPWGPLVPVYRLFATRMEPSPCRSRRSGRRQHSGDSRRRRWPGRVRRFPGMDTLQRTRDGR